MESAATAFCGDVRLSKYFGDTSVSPNHGVVVPVLCEAGVDTAYDGSRILVPRVTSQAVKLRLAANREAKMHFSLSLARYSQTRPANERRVVLSIDLMALPEGAGVFDPHAVSTIEWIKDRQRC